MYEKNFQQTLPVKGHESELDRHSDGARDKIGKSQIGGKPLRQNATCQLAISTAYTYIRLVYVSCSATVWCNRHTFTTFTP